jgi:hypothetical protein
MRPLPHTIRSRIAARSSLVPLKAPAFGVIDALQNHPADVQLEALALTFRLLAVGAGLDPHELVARAGRQIAEAEAVRNPIIEAVQAYAQGELR